MCKHAKKQGLNSRFPANLPMGAGTRGEGQKSGAKSAPKALPGRLFEKVQNWKLTSDSRLAQRAAQLFSASVLAGQVLHGPKQVFVARVRVDRRGNNRFVACKALGQANIAGLSKQVGARRVPQAVKAKVPLKSRSLLPLFKHVAQLAGRQARTKAANKQRRVSGQAVAGAFLPSVELVQLTAQCFRKNHFLRGGGGAAAFERLQDDTPLSFAGSVVHVSDIERQDLMLAQSRAKRQRQDHMIPKPVAMFAGDFQQQGLFALGHSAWWARDVISVIPHKIPQMCNLGQ